MQVAAEPQVHDSKKLVLVAIADVLILVELCIAMYFASQSDNVNSTFMTIFFGACIPTLLALFVAARILRKKNSVAGSESESMSAVATATSAISGAPIASGIQPVQG